MGGSILRISAVDNAASIPLGPPEKQSECSSNCAPKELKAQH